MEVVVQYRRVVDVHTCSIALAEKTVGVLGVGD
ncbi:unknown [Haloarcula marismortui ATCC 43049]|uniref:Uncharacterized protein n=1 Tax=Haloarcula marismortui (strain ATCC 43049 / DSM 3752 / JCM 8966 / VKM B-1809) TaxID=272569 RepID=Q5V227_HALMA|nr:unknown [Haloarcula marismortui ATCC 43049]